MKIVSISEAVSVLKNGDILGIPTETVYGLAADGLNEQAIRKVFVAKGRPVDNPLILHVQSIQMLDRLVKNISEQNKLLIEHFWPGPLTLVFDKSEIVPEIVTAGLKTVCIRMPRQKLTLELIKRFGSPLAAPSANKSGRPSPTDMVMFDKEMPNFAVLDGGVTEIGVESTVMDARGEKVYLLRQGGLPISEIERVLNKKVLQSDDVRSPGQLHKHYSPNGRVILFNSKVKKFSDMVGDGVLKSGIICASSKVNSYKNNEILDLGKNSYDHAKNLFHILQKTEELEWENVFVDLNDIDTGKGLADTVVERLTRAAN